MKVAYLLGSLNRGGTETLLLDVFRNADKAAYEMIGIHRKDGAYRDDIYATTPAVFQCKPKRFGLISYLLSLRKILVDNHVNIVHAQQTIDCIYAWMATIGTKIKIVETFHGFDFGKGITLKLRNRLSILLADKVVFVSNCEKDIYRKTYNIESDKCNVVYNGIDFSKFDIQYTEPDIFQKDKSSHRIRIVMVGNFVKGRSQNMLCQAIDILNKRGVNNFDFYFVGKRNDKEPWRYDNCVKYCKEHNLANVYFLGGRSDVPAILQHSDMFVYSSDHDTFGIAVIEAIASGLPTIVNDWEVMKEITQNGKFAGIYKSKDSIDCADKIQSAINNIECLKLQAGHNASEIRKLYSIDNHISNLNNIYQSL